MSNDTLNLMASSLRVAAEAARRAKISATKLRALRAKERR